MFRRRRLRRIHQLYLESSRGGGDRSEGGGCAGVLARIFLSASEAGLSPESAALLGALEWLEENCTKQPLREDTLRQYHRMIAPEGKHRPGEYRTGRAEIERSKVARPAGGKVPALMKQLDGRLESEQARLDGEASVDRSEIVKLAVGIHQRIAFIHPFEEANGRVARLAMNHLQRRYREGYVILPPLDRSPEHFEALEEAHLGRPEGLVALDERQVRAV